MKKLQGILSQIWRVLYFTYSGITFLLLYPFLFLGLFIPVNGRYPITFFFLQLWRTSIAYVSIIPKVEYSGQKFDSSKPYVICANHTSFLDIVNIYFAYSKYMHVMGKAELIKVPLFGILFKKMNIPVNRKSRIAAAKSLIQASNDLKRGISVAIFPEGTITSKVPKMIKFKAGAFKLAIDNQVPILPVTFVNNYHLFPEKIKNGWAGRPGIAKIVVHEPINTVGMNSDIDVTALSRQTYDIIEGPLKEAIKNYDLL